MVRKTHVLTACTWAYCNVEGQAFQLSEGSRIGLTGDRRSRCLTAAMVQSKLLAMLDLVLDPGNHFADKTFFLKKMLYMLHTNQVFRANKLAAVSRCCYMHIARTYFHGMHSTWM